MSVVKPVWKIPVVAVAIIAGAIGANQAGWSGAEEIVNAPLMGPIEHFVTGLLFAVGAVMTIGSALLVLRIAKPALFVMVPILLYFAVVLGAWNGFASDFDATRGEVIKHHWANAYALDHMSARGRFRTCEVFFGKLAGGFSVDEVLTPKEIQLTDDAKAVCARLFNVGPGEPMPGSEHKCGFLGMSVCWVVRDNTSPGLLAGRRAGPLPDR
jgi:hypothetical protein